MAKAIMTSNRESFESVANLFSVLADPTRLRILHLLEEKPAFVSTVVERLKLKQANVSKHLSVMYDAGLVNRERNGNQIRYSVDEPLVFELCNLVCQKLHREAQSKVRIFRRVVG
ncbi:metalloregulator ArsR/SmtB family transcription factor [soil metagenome]